MAENKIQALNIMFLNKKLICYLLSLIMIIFCTHHTFNLKICGTSLHSQKYFYCRPNNISDFPTMYLMGLQYEFLYITLFTEFSLLLLQCCALSNHF